MQKSLTIALIIIPMLAPAVNAQDLLASANAEVERLAAEQRPRPPASNDKDPYRLPGLIMLIGGGLLALAGAADTTGVRCESDAVSFGCSTTRNKGLIFTGIGIAGVGSYFLLRGQRERSPSVQFGPDGFAVRHRLSF